MSGTPEDAKKRIVDYFLATTEDSYLANWSGDSLGFHFGLADDTTQSLSESLANTNAFLAKRARIQAGSRVLDAGCGVGGSAIWLAQNIGALVTGVTLVDRQVELARKFADERGVSSLVNFQCLDMVATGFEAATFDVIWNLESLCHVVDVDVYLEHAYHLLRDGGCFACTDLCAGEVDDPNVKRTICNGWAMVLRRPSQIVESLARHGFIAIETADLTDRAMRCAEALEAMANRTLLKLRIEGELLGNPAPIYEGHVRAALAMVDGMRTRRTSVAHFLAWKGHCP
ncbi:MAG TPA: class I SAM-dependent methyltransferase [Polyangiaceae bacterium]